MHGTQEAAAVRKRRRVLPRPSSYTSEQEAKVGTCTHCKQQFFLFMMDVDHTHAIGLGGPDVTSNRRWLCVGCHRIKTVYEARYLFPLHRRLRDLLHTVRSHGTLIVPDTNILFAEMIPAAFNVDAARHVLERGSDQSECDTGDHDDEGVHAENMTDEAAHLM